MFSPQKCIALLGFLPTEMRYMYFPTLSYTRSLKKGAFSRHQPHHIGHCWGYTTGVPWLLLIAKNLHIYSHVLKA